MYILYTVHVNITQDTQNGWYESVVRCIKKGDHGHCANSDYLTKAPKCDSDLEYDYSIGVHYIGWNWKWDGWISVKQSENKNKCGGKNRNNKNWYFAGCRIDIRNGQSKCCYRSNDICQFVWRHQIYQINPIPLATEKLVNDPCIRTILNTKLQQLYDRGYTDTSLLIQVLIQTNGNICKSYRILKEYSDDSDDTESDTESDTDDSRL